MSLCIDKQKSTGMSKYEEVFFVSALLRNASESGEVDLSNKKVWQSLFYSEDTRLGEDYLYSLNSKGVLYYEEVGEEGFTPIMICSVNEGTVAYLKSLIKEVELEDADKQNKIVALNKRIVEILSFDPGKLSSDIKSTESTIYQARKQLDNNPVLRPLVEQLDQIEMHFKSLSSVANNYEEIYKNIILPVKEEGKSGVRETVKWAIISIVLSTFLSVVISWLMK